MNAIIHMNHSPKLAEPESIDLDRDSDIVALHHELVGLVGDDAAIKYGLTLAGKSYAEKCLAYRERIAESTPVEYVAAICSELDAQTAPVTVATMQAQQERLEYALMESSSAERVTEIISELAEIYAWFERESVDGSRSATGDQLRDAGFGSAGPM